VIDRSKFVRSDDDDCAIESLDQISERVAGQLDAARVTCGALSQWHQKAPCPLDEQRVAADCHSADVLKHLIETWRTLCSNEWCQRFPEPERVDLVGRQFTVLEPPEAVDVRPGTGAKRLNCQSVHSLSTQAVEDETRGDRLADACACAGDEDGVGHEDSGYGNDVWRIRILLI
jgi:hypothetical protein